MSEIKRLSLLIKKATEASTKANSAADDLAISFQPYFKGEISVLYQMGDGFVILYDEEMNYTEPVLTAHDNISKDINHYK